MAPFVKKIEVVIREWRKVVEDRCLSPDALLYSGVIHEETPFSLSASLHCNIQVLHQKNLFGRPYQSSQEKSR
jgi:hypothetical protein